MKPVLTIGCLLFLLFPVSDFLLPPARGQTAGWLWGRGNTGSGIDAYAVTTDASGNVYGAGVNYGAAPAAFGSNTVPNTATSGVAGGLGNIQPIWAKYSTIGVPLWADGTQNGDGWLYNITTDASGNLIVFGSFDSPGITIGGTTLTNAYGTSGDNQYFIAKYNPSGTLLWAIADGNSTDRDHYFLGVCILSTGGITTDAAGNIYVTSSFQDTTINIGGHTLTNMDPSGTTSDIFVAKYNSAGVCQWAKEAGGASDDFAYSIAIGNGGNVYITGPFWSPSVTFGSSTITNAFGGTGYSGFSGVGPGSDPLAYIAEFSPTGTPMWAQAAGGVNGAYGMGIVSDASGDIYMTGGFGDVSITFGSSTVTRTYPGAVPELALYLVRYSPANVVTWSKTIGSPTQGLWGFAIALAACGEVWVSGNYNDAATIDGHSLSLVAGSDPVFIAGYNLSGGVIGYSGLGSGGDDQNGIACDPSGNVYLCSDYYPPNPITIGPNTLSADSSAEMFYVAKYANIAIGPVDTTYQTSDTTLCNVPGLTLTAPVGYSGYLWDNSTTASTLYVNSSGSYWVICSSTCAIPTLIDTFHVIVSPTDTTYSYKDTSVCISSGAISLSSDPGFNDYQWSTGSTSSSISVSSAGLYWLTESNGCALRLDTFSLTLSPQPEVYLGNDTSLCQGNSLTLHCPEPPGYGYNWNTGSTDTSIVVTSAATYSLTVTNSGGCTASANITVQFIPVPTPLHLGPDTVLCDQQQYIISSGDSATLWNTGHTGAAITVVYTGLYTASISNECGFTTDSVRITFENCVITIPNAFTPNNDGNNDFFKVVGIELGNFKNFALSIYNRYGQRVYYSNNISDGWDGTFNGSPQDVDTYFYMVVYSLNGQSHMLKGDLELIR